MAGIIRDLGSNIIPIFGMGFAAYVIYLGHREKQKKYNDKLELIEKGLDPSLLDSKLKSRQSNLKVGLMFICIALGILFGYLIKSTFYIPNFIAYSTPILVFCGILLVYFHKSKIE